MVYRGLAGAIGWTSLPDEAEGDEVPVHEPGAETDWRPRADAVRLRVTRESLPARYDPTVQIIGQTSGLVDTRSGLMGRGAMVLVRREGSDPSLRIVVRKLPDVDFLYPLTLQVEIPSAAGGRRLTRTLPARGRDTLQFDVPIPEDIPTDTAIDVLLSTDRVAYTPPSQLGSSLFIESIEPTSHRR